MLATEDSKRTREERRPENTSDRSTTPSDQRLQSRAHRRAQGLRVRYGGIRLGCRESHTPWSEPCISIGLSHPVALTFYSRVTVHLALPPNHPLSHRTYIFTLRYYVPGLFSHFKTYSQLLKASVETNILHWSPDLESG